VEPVCEDKVYYWVVLDTCTRARRRRVHRIDNGAALVNTRLAGPSALTAPWHAHSDQGAQSNSWIFTHQVENAGRPHRWAASVNASTTRWPSALVPDAVLELLDRAAAEGPARTCHCDRRVPGALPQPPAAPLLARNARSRRVGTSDNEPVAGESSTMGFTKSPDTKASGPPGAPRTLSAEAGTVSA
jgi:hypothetical protein